MENDPPANPPPSGIFRDAEVRYEDLPVTEIAATGHGIPSTLFASPERMSEWDRLEQTFGELIRHTREQVAATGPEFFREIREQLLPEPAYEPSYVGGELDRKNLRMYEWQRGELYIHAAALILDPETTLEVAYEPEGRIKRLLLESNHRRITYLGDFPTGISQEEANAVAVWRTQRGKGAIAPNSAEFLDDLSDIYLDSLREALAMRRRFIDEYSIEPHRIRLAYDDQPYAVNYSQTKFRRAHMHALRSIREAPLDAREAIAASVRGTGEFGRRREARARAMVERVTQVSGAEVTAEPPSKYAVLWVRDNRDQAAYMDTKPEMLKQTIEILRATDPDRKIFLTGDDPFRGRPDLFSAFEAEGVFDGVDTGTLIRFWAAEKNGGSALTHGEQALFLHYLSIDSDTVQIGMESGALESGMCLGVPTVYFEAREQGPDKGERWQLYWSNWAYGESRVAEGPDGSKKFFTSGRPVKVFDRSGVTFPPPLMTVRRLEFGPELPNPADMESDWVTVYYPGNITVGVDQIGTLVESGGLSELASSFDHEWDEETWSVSEYYAEQIHRWTQVSTNDWEIAARRYGAITHALNGLVHPADLEVRGSYSDAGYHLALSHSQQASSVVTDAYRASPRERGDAVTAALGRFLTSEGFKEQCVHDLRLARLTDEEQTALASSVVEVTMASNILREIGRIAPDGSPATSKHIAESLALLLPRHGQTPQISTAAALSRSTTSGMGLKRPTPGSGEQVAPHLRSPGGEQRNRRPKQP